MQCQPCVPPMPKRPSWEPTPRASAESAELVMVLGGVQSGLNLLQLSLQCEVTRQEFHASAGFFRFPWWCNVLGS